jgi:hypothetical protein
MLLMREYFRNPNVHGIRPCFPLDLASAYCNNPKVKRKAPCKSEPHLLLLVVVFAFVRVDGRSNGAVEKITVECRRGGRGALCGV